MTQKLKVVCRKPKPVPYNQVKHSYPNLSEDMDYVIDNNSIPSTQEEYDENEEYWEHRINIT